MKKRALLLYLLTLCCILAAGCSKSSGNEKSSGGKLNIMFTNSRHFSKEAYCEIHHSKVFVAVAGGRAGGRSADGVRV